MGEKVARGSGLALEHAHFASQRPPTPRPTLYRKTKERTSRRTASHLLQLSEGKRAFWLRSTWPSFSAMKRAFWRYARMVSTPESVSWNDAKMGLLVVASRRLSSREVAR